ncbi:hypothetical protein AA18890_2434 [Komagataeibacter europaeus LMG 18890]|nr:hypothetical protein AA18890_2434 [Komagataeibacter europaeus LMG 18890]
MAASGFYVRARTGRICVTLTADRDNQYLMFNSMIVRAHQQAANGKGAQGSDAGVGHSAQGCNRPGLPASSPIYPLSRAA